MLTNAETDVTAGEIVAIKITAILDVIHCRSVKIGAATHNQRHRLRDWLQGYSDQFREVIAEKLLIYALGRGTEYFDMPVVRSIVRDAERVNYRFSSLVLGVVKSEAFQMNQKPPAAGQTAMNSR